MRPSPPKNSLIPCPNCGTQPGGHVVAGMGPQTVVFKCNSCGRSTRPDQSFEEARMEWNTIQEQAADRIGWSDRRESETKADETGRS